MEGILSEQRVEQLKQLDTCCLSDAMDRLGLAGGLKGIKPVMPGVRMCGRAFTVHYVPCGVTKGTVGDFLDDVQPGEIVVIDNGGRDYCTVWGDLMTITANRNKVGGTLIDGVCRDVPLIRKMCYPIFTKGHYMVTGKDRVEVDAINIPVSICGIQVKQGDWIVADDTGALVIPQERVGDVLDVAIEIAEKEALIESELQAGKTLRDARNSVSYHLLQTRQ